MFYQSSEFIDLVARLSFNIVVVFIIIKLIYTRRKDNNDFIFTFYIFNALIFFVAYLLSQIEIGIGFGFGLFALFAILRYRTDPIPIKEMTYLFLFVAIGMINSLIKIDNSYLLIIFTNFTLVLLTYIVENRWQVNVLLTQSILYEKIENIKPENFDKLKNDLEDRTGLDINHLEIRKINFLRDTARIRIFYKEK